MAVRLTEGERNLAGVLKIPISPTTQSRKASAGAWLKSALHGEELLVQRSC